MQQKIAVFILSFESAKWAKAVYDDGYLTFGEVKPLKAKISDLEEKVKPSISKLMQSGFKVLVDEVSPKVTAGTGASMVRLSDKHHDGRPVLVVGIDRYRELRRMGALVLPPKSGDRFSIPDDVVESEFSSSGDEVYRINWAVLTADHVIMILSCYATVFNPVNTAAYIDAVCEGAEQKAPSKGMMAAFHRIIGKTEEVNNPPTPDALAGSVIDKNTWIL